MTKIEIENIVNVQREYFLNGRTLSVKNRRQYLTALKNEIIAREKDIEDALYEDLGKSPSESYLCEIGLTLDEISYLLKNLTKLTKVRRVKTPLSQFAAKSYRVPSPYGSVLIMSPWNYPFLLSMEPLVEAIAAGNVVLLKPSNYSPKTSLVMTEILTKVFPKELVFVVLGGRAENAALLDIKFDYIFFTGGKTVGKLVYRKAAEFLTPVTLELGGKSPCVVDKTAKLPLAARRIVFGKFLNAGQTCVAPDYILVHESVKDDLIKEIKKEIVRQYGDEPLKNDCFGKIVTDRHFDRIVSLIDQEKVVHGGKCDKERRKIEPTVLDNVTDDDAVMKEEIFGPILPILTYRDVGDILDRVNLNSSPLAFYVFTEDKMLADGLMKTCRYGGGCVNDVVIHLATPYMPFGGFGESGLGGYHGKYGFETFTHFKSVIDKSTKIDLNMRYQPYKESNDRLIKKFLK